MPGNGEAVDIQAMLPTGTLLSCSAQVQSALRSVKALDVTIIRPGALRATWAYRPWWSVIAAVVLTPAAGLGLLLLLVKRTAECGVRIEEASRRVVMTAEGRLPNGVVRELVAMLDATVLGEPVLDAAALDAGRGPAGPLDLHATIALDRATIPRRNAPPVQARGHDGPAAVTVRLDSGELKRTNAGMVVGRAPVAVDVCPGALLVVVDDAHRSVSKNHLAIGVDDTGAWVEDLGSTNGTVVVDSDGIETHLDGGQRTPLLTGALVAFGSRTMRVESAP